MMEFALSVALWSTAAPVESVRSESGALSVTAPTSCPDAFALRERVEALLGSAWRGDATRATVTIDGEVAQWQLALVLTAGAWTENRTLTGNSCEELVQGAALVIAAALRGASTLVDSGGEPSGDSSPSPDPSASGSSPSPADEPERVRPVPTSPPDRVRPTRETPLPPRRRPGWPEHGILRLEGGADFGAVAPVTGGLRIAVGIAWPWARLEALGSYWFRRRTEFQPGSGADVSLGAAELRGCGRIKFAPVEFPVCLGVEAGGNRSRGVGLRNASRAVSPWLALMATPGIVVRVHSRIGVFVAPQLWVALVRPRIVSQAPGDAEQTIYRVPYGGGRATAGFEFRL